MPTVNPPRGMRDILPADKANRERVLSVIRHRFRAHGFDEIETPAAEDYDRLHAGIGGDNEKLSFNIMRRGLDAEAIREAADDPAALADLGLRYDLTVPLARFFATNRADLPGVFRAIQIGPVWRAERPQKGRYRQFVQCDIDVIGDASSRAEAELLAASLDTLDTLGLSGGVVRINDRRLLEWMLDTFGFTAQERPAVLITIDKLDKIGVSGVIAELRERASVSAVDAIEQFMTRPQTTELVPFGERQIRRGLPDGAPEELVSELTSLGAALESVHGTAPLVFDPFLVRGMGYYTGTIFELVHPSVNYSLGGGGRYDGMIGRFIGQAVPAVGFSLGFERLVDLLEIRGGADDLAVVLIADGDVPLAEQLSHKAAFVAAGYRVRLEKRPQKLKPLLDRAAKDGYREFALLRAGESPSDLRPLA